MTPDLTKISRPGERWLPIPGHSPYLASDLGRIYSPARGRRAGRLLRMKPNKDGYRRVAFWEGNKRTPWGLGPLILTVFVGPRPEGSECCHGAAGPADNSLSNLRWGTPVENDLDKDEHGTRRARENHHQAKMNYGLAKAVRRLGTLKAATTEEMAEWFGVSTFTIAAIVRGDRWDPEKPLASGAKPSRPKKGT